MAETFVKIAKFLAVVGVFYVAPLLTLLLWRSTFPVLAFVFLVVFPLGYYFLYMMMRVERTRAGTLVEMGGGPDDVQFRTPDSQSAGAMGYLTFDPYGERSVASRIRFRALGRGFLYHLIPFLLLMLLLLAFSDLLKQNEFRNLQPNMAEAIVATGDAMELILRATRPDDLPFYTPWKYEVAILNVEGWYDRADLVLGLLKFKFKTIRPDMLADEMRRPEFPKYKVCFINCPGNVDPLDAPKLRAAVEAGLWLFTTDWALLNALARVTPGYVASTGDKTPNGAVPISAIEPDHAFTRNVAPAQPAPSWWVFFSYPIKVLKEDLVKTFMSSSKLEKDYAAPAVAVTYPFGAGRVVHVIGHFHQQICFADGGGDAYGFVTGDLAVPSAAVPEPLAAALRLVPRDRFAQAYSVMRLVANVLIERRRGGGL